jgi:hypothetical protein
MLKNSFAENFSSHTLLINYLFIILIFGLNFLGLSQLQYVYLAYIGFAFLVAFTMDLKTSILIILTYSFIEGQARILWNYHPFFRLSFDLLVGAALIHSLLVKRNLENVKALPKYMLVLLVLHIGWYLVELFNPNSVSGFAALAAMKIYIFPFLVFLIIRNHPEIFKEKSLDDIVGLLILLIILESILALYQGQILEGLLLSISPYYQNALKNIFIGSDFRPFGTGFLPGVISIYLFLTFGFLFIRRKLSTKYIILVFNISCLVFLTVLSSHVRSALVKLGLLLIGCILTIFISSNISANIKYIRAMKFLVAFLLFGATAGYVSSEYKIINFERALGRWEKVTSYEAFKSGRAGPEQAAEILRFRLTQYPLGLGPGVTGAASSVAKSEMENDPIYTRDTFWGYDNLFLSIVVEFGYGAIFYILLVVSIPIILLKRSLNQLKLGHNYEARVILIAFFQVSIILLGNWGAIGLPYNPESFFFWLWTAVALNISKEDDSRAVNVPT